MIKKDRGWDKLREKGPHRIAEAAHKIRTGRQLGKQEPGGVRGRLPHQDVVGLEAEVGHWLVVHTDHDFICVHNPTASAK